MWLRPRVQVAILCIGGALASAVQGCEGKQRPFADYELPSGYFPAPETGLLPSGNGPEASGGFVETGFGALGSACAVDSGCASGICVAGRCCERACDGLCEACSAAGRCEAPADDPSCPAIPCQQPPNGCATFPEAQAAGRCEAVGVCKTTCDPLSVAVDTTCLQEESGIEGRCDAAGNCIDPRAALGGTCQSDLGCAVGTCVDGVCCAEPCGDACEACDGTGACQAEAAGTVCGDSLQCFGRGLCLAPNGSVCQGAAQCGSGNCEPAVGGGTVCCAASCVAGLLCNSDGVCVSPEADLGAACVSNGDCVGGRCVDGVCCDSDCSDTCEVCNAPGQEGRCAADTSGEVDPACAPGTECAGRGLCLLPLGAACALNGECKSGECGPSLAGPGEICCEAACPSGQRCSAAGSCVDAPRPGGSECTTGTDCLSANCVAGRCCEGACDGVCQACSGLGECNLSPGNDSQCAPVDCPTSTTVCVSYPADITTNLCAAFGSCRSAQQECQPRFAPAGTPCETIAPGVIGTCNGAGSCADPRVGLGFACTTGSQCVSGNCAPRAGAGSVCCDEACNGICEACSANGICESRQRGLSTWPAVQLTHDLRSHHGVRGGELRQWRSVQQRRHLLARNLSSALHVGQRHGDDRLSI